jgi:CheY-like chemotaxis protein/HPt (histidine-containing phosphotransfer) domain-containing protein
MPTVEFPRPSDTPVLFPAAASAWEPRVLVVDDDEISRLAAVGLLRSLGLTVDVASGGREALELGQRWAYVAIFMDCEMPEVDGYTAARTLRSGGGANSHTPVIAITSHPRSVSIASGMDHHLTKPPQIDVLQADCARMGLIARDGASASASEPARQLCIDTPLLDPEVFVQNVVGSGNRRAEAATTFLAEATIRLPELWRATNGGDAPALQRLALVLGGQAARVGTGRVRALCERLSETAARHAAGAGDIELQLRRVLHDTGEAIAAHLDLVAFANESAIQAPGPSDAEVAPDPNHPSPPAPVRVVLAEDDQVARIAVRAMLECADWIQFVGDAAGAEEAVELAAVERPDVVVLDWIMPGGTGRETVRRILRHSPGTLIVVLTSSDSLEALAEMISAGAACLVAKGGSAKQLTQTIGRALKASASARAAEKQKRTGRREIRVGATQDVTSENGSPLDPTGVKRLHAEFGSTGILFELVELFGSETPKRLSDLRSAIEAGDAHAVSEHAHQLKGGCLTLAAEYMAKFCNQLETTARDGSLEGAAALAGQIEAAFQAAHAALLGEAHRDAALVS